LNVDVDPLLYEPFVDGINNVSKIIIHFRVATFKCGIFSALHKFHETACVSYNSRVGVSRGLATLEWVVSRRLARGSRLVTLRVDCARICYLEGKSLASLSSRVLASNKGLSSHRTLHECTRISQNNAIESDVAFERYCSYCFSIYVHSVLFSVNYTLVLHVLENLGPG